MFPCQRQEPFLHLQEINAVDVTPALFWALTQGLDCARGSELFTYNAQLCYKEPFEKEAWRLSQKQRKGPFVPYL